MNTGWNCFFSLLIALVVGALSARLLHLEGWTPWVVGLVVFVLFVIFFTINSMLRCRRKRLEEKAEKENDD